jgi:hypothetical protein
MTQTRFAVINFVLNNSLLLLAGTAAAVKASVTSSRGTTA